MYSSLFDQHRGNGHNQPPADGRTDGGQYAFYRNVPVFAGLAFQLVQPFPLPFLLLEHSLHVGGQPFHRGRNPAKPVNTLFQRFNAPVLAGVFRVDPLGKFLMLCPFNTVFHLRHLFPQAFGTDYSRFPYVVVHHAFPRLSVVRDLIPFGISVGTARLFPFRDNRRLWNQHLCPQGRRYIRRPAFLRRVRCQAFIQNIRVPHPVSCFVGACRVPCREHCRNLRRLFVRQSGRLKLHRLINLLCPFYLVHYSLTPNNASTCDCKAATCASSCSSRLGSG